jgi:hypothetical protein
VGHLQRDDVARSTKAANQGSGLSLRLCLVSLLFSFPYLPLFLLRQLLPFLFVSSLLLGCAFSSGRLFARRRQSRIRVSAISESTCLPKILYVSLSVKSHRQSILIMSFPDSQKTGHRRRRYVHFYSCAAQVLYGSTHYRWVVSSRCLWQDILTMLICTRRIPQGIRESRS